MAKTCPSVARSQLQSVYVMLEDTSGVLQPVAEDGYIVPVGRATMIQTPSYSDSEELSTSLNPIDQFQDAVPAGTGSISIYGRLDPNYGKPEGHALFEALMGDYNDPTKMTAKLSAAAPADTASITLKNIINGNDIDENILAGSFPPRGVIKIGTEKILYSSLTKGAGGAATISGLKRGYANTKAAEHEADTPVSMLSRIYSQSICRPTCSIYILNDDKLLLFMSGCSITQDTVRLQRETGQMFTFEFQGQRMGWAGCSEVAADPSTSTIQLKTGGADAYTVGGYIRNRTKRDTNNGKGFRIVGVNDAADTIAVSPVPTGWKTGDKLEPWLPKAPVIGTPLESRFANVEIDGKVGKMADGGLTISCPVTNLLEIGDEYVGEGISTRRSITLDRNVNFRMKDGMEFGKGYRGYELPVTVFVGKYPGLTLAHHMGRVKFLTPEINESDNVVTMKQNGTALGITGEDALYIIQE